MKRTMLRTALCLSAIALCLGPAPVTQGPDVDIFGRPRKRTEGSDDVGNQPLAARDLLGMWRLTGMDDEFIPEDGRSLQGYVLFTESFMAIELHVMWDDLAGNPIEDDFESGIHAYVVDPAGQITSVAMIGAFLDEDEVLEYTPAGTPWGFRSSVFGSKLTLRRTDNSTMTFERVASGLVRRDIFGRQMKGLGGVDIYGRPLPPIEPEETPPTDDR